MDDRAASPAFRGPFPIFTVSDLPRSLAFFHEALGFEAGYQWPANADANGVEFIVLTLDGASIGLGRGESDAVPSGAQLCLEVTDIHGAWKWVLAHGGTVVAPPVEEQ